MDLESTNAKGLLFLVLAFAGKILLAIYLESQKEPDSNSRIVGS